MGAPRGPDAGSARSTGPRRYRQGPKVYISSRKAEVCDALAEQLAEHGTCISLPADLGTADGCDQLAAQLAEREPRLHVLVNNAGAAWGAPLGEYSADGFDKVMDLNVRAVFLLTQALAVHQLGRHLGKVMAADHVTVNAIAPGLFPSKMTAFMFEHEDAVVAQIPMRRPGPPRTSPGRPSTWPPGPGLHDGCDHPGGRWPPDPAVVARPTPRVLPMSMDEQPETAQVGALT